MAAPVIVLEVAGSALPYRERQRVVGGRTYSYKQSTIQQYQLMLRQAAQEVMGDSPLHTGPVRLEVTFYMPIPKTMKRADRGLAELELLPHIKRPDITSMIRAVEDAFTGVVWADDSQVSRSTLSKLYSPKPRICVVIQGN